MPGFGLSANVYAAPANTLWKAPDPPALVKFRPLFGAAAVADRVQSSATLVPPSLLVTT